jgi:hypothetical protein
VNEQSNLRQEKIHAFTMSLFEATDLAEARRIADQAFAEKDPELKMQMLSMSAAINPLAVPNLPKGADASRMFTFDAWRKSIIMARIVAGNSNATRVLIASAPKTGSTFLASAIAATYRLTRASLTLLSAKPYGNTALGGSLREENIDELALVTNGFIPDGYVAHHHMICTPYLGKQLSLYGVLPVITRRNFFDTLVSFDEHFRKNHASNSYRTSGLPGAWFEMEFDDRMEMLLDIQLPWFMRYYSTWKLCEAAGDVKPLWITYETDVLGDKTKLAEKIVERLTVPPSSIPLLADELQKVNPVAQNLNKGVAGRGAAITGRNRRKIEDFFHRFRSVCDFSDILDG